MANNIKLSLNVETSPIFSSMTVGKIQSALSAALRSIGDINVDLQVIDQTKLLSIIVDGVIVTMPATFTQEQVNQVEVELIAQMQLFGFTVITNAVDPSLLLHLDANTNDSSPSSKVVTNTGVVIDTVTKKFGTGSGKFNGNSSYLTVDDSLDWAFDKGDFTIEFWVNFANTSTGQTLIRQSNLSDIAPVLLMYLGGATDKLALWVSYDGIQWGLERIDGQKSDFVAGTWYHIAIVRYGSILTVYVNGLADIVANLGDSILFDCEFGMTIGASHNPVNQALEAVLNGNLDELRIVKGTAIYTENFIPPSAPFPSNG